MDEAYERLRKQGKNSVDDIIKWMKESKVIEQTKESEANARKLFEGVHDTTNVELAKFMEAVAKLAAQQKKSVEELTRMLSEETPKFLKAAQAGIDAFKEAFKK